MREFFQQVFSITCSHCEERASTALGLCASCENEIPWHLRTVSNSEILRASWSLGPYHGVLGSLIRKGKYRPSPKIFTRLGVRLAHACLDLPGFDAVVSVPLPWQRSFKRGFNQSAILADQIGNFLEVPHLQPLYRLQAREQAGKSLKERQKKIAGRFALKYSYQFQNRILNQRLPKKILLVDDVCTTGGTLDGCAMELYEGGVEEIVACTIAHVQLG